MIGFFIILGDIAGMRSLLVALLLMLQAPTVLAADPGIGAPVCGAIISGLSDSEIMATVESHYGVADAAIEDNRAIYSSRQIFPWALETRFACGRAIGFWQGGSLHAQSVIDCDCFYNRMMTAR